MFYVYAIYNKDHDKIYIGETEDIGKRLELHNNKFFRSSYTARYSGWWQLIHKESFETRSESRNREKQLKSYRGREYIKNLINNPL